MEEEKIKQYIKDNLRIKLNLQEDPYGGRGVQVILYFKGDDKVIASDEQYYKWNCKLD